MQPEIALPYRTDWRDLANLLDYCKGKGADRSALEARFGSGESLRETLNALEQLRLIERGDAGDVRLSLLGEQLAYAPDAARQRERLTEALLGYAPYRFPLERAVADTLRLLDAPWVEHIWQVDMRLGQPRNRVEEARTFFFRLADEAGLGTYRRGVRGQTTRLELAANFAEQIGRADAARQRARQAPEPPVAARGGAARYDRAPQEPAAVPVAPSVRADAGSPSPRQQDERDAADAWAAAPRRPERATSDWSSRSTERRQPDSVSTVERQPAAALDAVTLLGATPSGAPVAFNVRVDMTDWDLDKIAAFLRLIGYAREQG